MSRRRTSVDQRSAFSAAPTTAGVSVDAGAPDWTELHRLAADRRAARMAARSGGAVVTIPGAASVPGTPAASPAITMVLPVAGMTCRSCEVRIERHVGRLPNVSHVAASAVHGRVEIETTGPVSTAAIEQALHKAGYALGTTPWVERSPSAWATAAAGVLLLALFVVAARVTGLADLATGAGDISRGGVMIAVMLGLAAGVSTCMALVGGIILALSASFEASRSAAMLDGQGLAARMRPALVFMGGRIVGYAVLGAFLGALGAGITLPPQATAVLMIVVAVVMTLIGTRLTGLSPRVAAWSPTLPPGISRSLGLHEGTVASYSDGRAAALGVASFFLPCGFTQAVQVYALSTGSPVTAGVIMAAFAIGTAPGLLALAGLPVVVPVRVRPTLLRLVGVVVIGFAMLNATAGLRLVGIGIPSLGGVPAAEAAVPAAAVAATDGTQALTTYQDADGYRPANAAIYAGLPTRWTIQSSTVRSCAAFLVVPDLGIQLRLHEGSNTVDLPALSAGTLNYSCSMGMYGGSISIVDRPTGSTGDATGG